MIRLARTPVEIAGGGLFVTSEAGECGRFCNECAAVGVETRHFGVYFEGASGRLAVMWVVDAVEPFLESVRFRLGLPGASAREVCEALLAVPR